ncbi:HAD-IA family hydrolase [Candidatus Dependentiae bacterium]
MRKWVLKKIKILLLACTFCVTSMSYGVNVIFDLEGVLLKINKSAMFKQMSKFTLLKFLFSSCFSLQNPFNIEPKLFAVLKELECDYENTYGATDGKGNKLPDILCAWSAGEVNSQEILSKANLFLQTDTDVLPYSTEKNFVREIIKTAFNPECFIKATTEIKDGIEFAKKCKEEGHEIFVLSNWDKESWNKESGETMYTKFKDLFGEDGLFEKEKVIISGEVGCIKPDPNIYFHLLNKHGLRPQESIFFDDQEVNVRAAEKLGIRGVLCKNKNYNQMLDELNKFTDEKKKESLARQDFVSEINKWFFTPF